MHPATALLIAGGVAAAAILLFRPVHGWFWRWLRAHRISDRVWIEDARRSGRADGPGVGSGRRLGKGLFEERFLETA